MDKIVLIDGNNLLFRSYYATIYSGSLMKNSKGIPTNALYGFCNMINKILNEEKPKYILVAFDKGKTFRHDSYTDYKAGRIAMPDELKSQFPIAKELLDAMGIKWFEIDGYEADDIVGTMSEVVNNSDFNALIISSDRDLLQLITDKVTVKLLKPKDYVMMDEKTFVETYGINPIKIIDLKGLQGDASDNIPGVKGVGEKTALKLLQEYGSVENIYVNIDKISGKLKEKLIDGKDDAFMSKSLATIYKEVPLPFSIEDTLYKGNTDKLRSMYEDLEFYSFIKNMSVVSDEVEVYTDLNGIDLSEVSIYLDVDNPNYHFGNIIGMSFYTKDKCGYIKKDFIKDNIKYFEKSKVYTYDLKKNICALKRIGISFTNYSFDTMVASYLLNYNVKDDIAYLANSMGYSLMFSDDLKKKSEDVLISESVKKSKFIFETHNLLIDKLKENECLDLYNNIEFPLSFVLADMENTGIKVDKEILVKMKDEIYVKIDLLKNEIYNMAGCEFNINSPKQLGDILFDKIGVPSNKKRSTDKEFLVKYRDKYQIIDKVLEYKMLSKIYSTYLVSIMDFIVDDKIHTIYNQTLTKTGRLSSSYPNLQNIPTRYEYAKLVRKAFIPRYDYIVSSDYSQIELRVLAHLCNSDKLTEAFNSGVDIHTKTAMEVFNVSESEVNSNMRRQAKAVNFGIIYGISGFGLSENLDINVKDAKEFIDRYFVSFPGVKEYMDNVVKEARECGYVKTIMNRKRYIDELKNPNYMIRSSGERMAQNSGIQGSAADIIKKAMIDMQKRLKEENLESKMILQIHDELVFDVKESELDKLQKIIKDVMENVVKLNVPLEVEISSGKDWYEV